MLNHNDEIPCFKISKKPQVNFFLYIILSWFVKYTIRSVCVSKWLIMYIMLSTTSFESQYVYNSRMKILVMVTYSYSLPQMIQYQHSYEWNQWFNKWFLIDLFSLLLDSCLCLAAARLEDPWSLCSCPLHCKYCITGTITLLCCICNKLNVLILYHNWLFKGWPSMDILCLAIPCLANVTYTGIMQWYSEDISMAYSSLSGPSKVQLWILLGPGPIYMLKFLTGIHFIMLLSFFGRGLLICLAKALYRDVRFKSKHSKKAKNFCNKAKIWGKARYLWLPFVR